MAETNLIPLKSAQCLSSPSRLFVIDASIIKITGVPIKQMKWLKSILLSPSTNHDPVHRGNPGSAVSDRNRFLSVTLARKECILSRWEASYQLKLMSYKWGEHIRIFLWECFGMARQERKSFQRETAPRITCSKQVTIAEERRGFPCAFEDSRQKLRRKQKADSQFHI